MKKAFSILEAIIALALFLLLVSGLGVYMSWDLGQLADRQKRIEAESLVVEAKALVNALARENWSVMQTDVTSLVYENSVWHLASSETAEQVGDLFTRSVVISEVCRDEEQRVVDCPGQVIDAGTYKLAVTIAWLDSRGQQSLTEEFYITKWW